MNKDSLFGIKNNLIKTGNYLKKVGVRSTAKRVETYILTHNRYMKWRKQNTLLPEEIEEHKKLSENFNLRPKISIIVPLYRTKDIFLEALIKSVLAQTYSNFELVLPDGSENYEESKRISKYITRNYPNEKRICYKLLPENLGIAGNTNEGLKLASGEWIAFLDHDDFIDEDALFQMVSMLNSKPGLKMIYTDEDKTNVDGTKFFYPHFKPDFNIDLLRASNYICHFLFVRRDIMRRVGEIRSNFDGAQDYDYVLRCVEEIDDPEKIGHISKPLYHWRVHDMSTAGSLDSKSYARNAGKNALLEHLLRQDIPAEVLLSDEGEFYRVKYLSEKKPLVSIIIYSKNSMDTKNLLLSIAEQDYTNYEILLYSRDSEVRKEIKGIKELLARTLVYEWKGEDIKYEVYNHAVSKCKDEIVIFMDKDIVLKDTGTISELVNIGLREDVGSVSGRIYKRDGSLHHAGLFVGGEKLVERAFYNKKEEDGIYFNRSRMSQDFTALTSEMLLIKKSMFKLAKGFDMRLGETLGAADFCMRLGVDGYLNVYAPMAKASIFGPGMEYDIDEHRRRIFIENWLKVMENGDIYYNPNMKIILYKSKDIAYNR